MKRLRLTSCMAPVMDSLVADLAGYLQDAVGIEIQFSEREDWQERQRLFDRGAVELAWICGLPYVWHADAGAPLELLAAPVMDGERYMREPVYFSEIVVAAQGSIESIADLKGARWGYNERGSQSGYNAARVWLERNGLDWDHFGPVYEAGTHSRALRWLQAGLIDGAAIDTTVIDWERRREPELVARLRTIDVLGPSPIPPWTVQRRVPTELRRALRKTMLNMQQERRGQGLLARHGLQRFAAVEDADYDLIRRWDRRASRVGSPSGATASSKEPDGSLQ